MAGTMNTITMIFDSHIQSVSDESKTNTWTSSGQTISFPYGSALNAVVTLDNDYELDTVSTTVGTATIGEDKKSFVVDGIPDATVTITLTSKSSGGGTMTKQVDLSTLSDWANLADGEHTITIKAKADGYRTSQASTGVSVTKGSTGETWVLNETLTSGLIYWSGDVSTVPELTKSGMTVIDFTSNNETFFGITTEDGTPDPVLPGSTYTWKRAYYNGSWTNTAYRTITFSTAPTGDLLTWLQANGTKQGGGN